MKGAYTITFGTKVNGRVPSVYSIKHCMTIGSSFHANPIGQIGTTTGREVIPMFSHFKNITIHIVLDTAGALFDRLKTSAFRIYAMVRGSGGRFCFWAPCHEEVVRNLLNDNNNCQGDKKKKEITPITCFL